MFTLRCAMMGARALARGLGVWPVAVVALWPVLAKLQEPAFFRTQGVPFLWPSQQALLLFVLALLPVVPRLTQGQAAAAWTDRLVLRPHLLVISTWLAGCLYGCLLLAVGCAACYSVERILAPGEVASDGSEILTTALACAGFLSATAAATPLLDHAPGPAAWVVTGWMIVVLLLIPVIGPPPLEISPSPVASPVFSGMFSAVLATCGGLSLSIALSSQRLRA